MAWSLLQSASGNNGGSGNLSVAFTTANVQSGSKIIAFVACSAGAAVTTSSVKDGANNSWTLIGHQASGNNDVSIWALDVPAGDVGTKPTLTAVPSVAAGVSMVIQEVSGLLAGNTTAMCDGSPAGTATVDNPTYTTHAANEYLVSVYGDDGGSRTITAHTGWTLDAHAQNTSSVANCCPEYKNSTGGSETDGFTGVGGTYEELEVAFKLPGGGTGPVFRPAVQAVRARPPLGGPKAGIVTAELGKGTGNVSGPLNGAGFGAGIGANGAPVKNPTKGPVFEQAVMPIRAQLPTRQVPVPGFGLTGTVTAELAKGTGNIAGPVTWHGGGQGANGAPVKNPTQGPVFEQAVMPCGPRIPQNIQPTSERVNSNPGSRPHNPTRGPVFEQATTPAQARLPQQPVLRGRCYSSPGAPVHNPTPGPVFRSKPAPVRFILPPPQPRAGRIGSSPGGPVINPHRGPPVYALLGPSRARVPQNAPRGRVLAAPPAAAPVPPPFFPAVQALRARVPQQPLLRGRVMSNPGGPVRNPHRGPVFEQATTPAQARIPQVFSKGRAASNPGALVPPVTGPVFRPKTTVRAQLPLPARGTVRGTRFGSPPVNPVQGPVFYPQTRPARARILPPGRGTVRRAAAPAAVPVTPGPPFYPARQAIRARLPQLQPRAGRITSSPGAPVRNPSAGTLLGATPGAVRAALPQHGPGRVASNPGGPVINPAPPTTGPVFRPVRVAAAKITWPPRRGICRTIRFGALPVNQAQGPVFRQATVPARARITLPPRGRVASNPGGPVQNPPPPVTGPVFRPANTARAQYQPPRRGTARTIRFGALPVNPTAGPVFRQAAGPARARIPLLPRGRVTSNPGAPVPPLPVTGPVFRQATQPARARIILPPRGRIASNRGGPIQNPPPPVTGPVFHPRNTARAQLPLPARGTCRTIRFGSVPVNPTTGPVFRQATSALQARLPVPFLKGRTAGNPGAPVRKPTAGPVIPQPGQPSRARFPQPPRGRITSNPGTPAHVPAPPAAHPAGQAVRAKLPQQPTHRGTCRTIRFTFAPVNPVQGPVFRQAVQPARTRIPQNAPRGRTSSNPGGPVQNPVSTFLLVTLGAPFTLWEPQEPFTLWDTATTITTAQAGEPFIADPGGVA